MGRTKLMYSLVFIALIAVIYLTFSQVRNSKLGLKTEEYVDSSAEEETPAKKGNIRVITTAPKIKKIFRQVSNYVDMQKSGVIKSIKGYVKDEIMFENIKEIDWIIGAEYEELKKVGIKLDLNLLKHTDLKEDTSKRYSNFVHATSHPDNPTGSTNQDKIKSRTHTEPKIYKKKYKFRNPHESLLRKLTKEQMDIETATDPTSASVTCKEEVFLLVLVVSQPENIDRRNFIRDSWANSYVEDHAKLAEDKIKPFPNSESYRPDQVVKTVFILGQSKQGGAIMKEVLEEAKLKKDIIFGNLIEDYRNLTMKTRLGLKWAFYECKSTYVIKTDDDVFVNPVPLIEWLKEMPQEKFYTGWCNFNSPVVRDKRNKWYVSYEDFGADKYPGYCLGGGYLMSDDVLGAVLHKSYGRKLFPMEDLYVGLLIHELGNVPVKNEKKHFDLIYGGRKDDCDFNDLFLAHQVFGENQIEHIKRAQSALLTC